MDEIWGYCYVHKKYEWCVLVYWLVVTMVVTVASLEVFKMREIYINFLSFCVYVCLCGCVRGRGRGGCM